MKYAFKSLYQAKTRCICFKLTACGQNGRTGTRVRLRVRVPYRTGRASVKDPSMVAPSARDQIWRAVFATTILVLVGYFLH